MSQRLVLACSLFAGLIACTQQPGQRSVSTGPTEPPANAHAGSDAPVADATVIAKGKPLQAGTFTFTGMVVPTTRGYLIGDAVVDGPALLQRLPPPVYTPGLANNDPEWFVGAELRVTGLLEQVSSAESQFAVRRIDAVAVATPAVMIEGTLATSKGFYQLASYLINRDDLASALPPSGGAPGDQLRLWGQPRIVKCAPNAQCLLTGELPIFVIGRAHRLVQ